MAFAIQVLCWRWKVETTVGVLAALCLPMAIVQRMPEGEQQSSWNEVASFIAAQRADDTDVLQAVIPGPVRQHMVTNTRAIASLYPAAFASLVDVNLKLLQPSVASKLTELGYSFAGEQAVMGVNVMQDKRQPHK